MNRSGIFLTFLGILMLLTTPVKSQLVINELMAANATTLIEKDHYGFPDWIELLNTDSLEAYQTTDHYLSDDRAYLKQWKLPEITIEANEYLLIYCDGKEGSYHANFGLGTDGETIYLSDEAGNILDSLLFPVQYPDVSFGRSATDIENTGYCIDPTPGGSNTMNVVYVQDEKPVYSIPAGVIENPVTLSISGSDVRYTLNGDEPNSTSNVLTDDILIDETTTVKSKSFGTGLLPSDTYANTYFYDEHDFTLPVVSLTFNEAYFYDSEIGIHVRGSNGTAGYCGDVANWNQDWERAAYFEYFDKNGNKQISQLIGVKIGGGCTRGRDQKSLKLYARNQYGDNDFDHAFFNQKPHIDRYQSLLLRNSGNDQDQTLLRDAAVQAMVHNAMDIDYQSYQPTIVYFNGEYRGIMNLREKIDEDYFDSNYDLDDDTIDFLERNMEVIRGSAEDFNVITSFVSSNDMRDVSNYDSIASQLDIQEFINYFAMQIYMGNRDWPQNNIKFWKQKDNGKWRWILFDTDYGFGFRMDAPNHETFDKMFDESSDDAWSTLLYRKLMNNQHLRDRFLANFYTQMYSHFHPEWCDYIIDSLASGIMDEISYNQEKYGRTLYDWIDWIDVYKDQTRDRFDFMEQYTRSYFNFQSDPVTLSIHNPYPHKGEVIVNEIKLQQSEFSMNTFEELPLTLEAVPASSDNYFIHWRYSDNDEVYNTDRLISLENSTDLSLTAVFAPQEDDPVSNTEYITRTNHRDQFNIKVFPNPSKTGMITIHASNNPVDEDTRYKISVTNMVGHTVLVRDNLDLKDQQLDLSFLEKGIYFLNIYRHNALISTKKVVIP